MKGRGRWIWDSWPDSIRKQWNLVQRKTQFQQRRWQVVMDDTGCGPLVSRCAQGSKYTPTHICTWAHTCTCTTFMSFEIPSYSLTTWVNQSYFFHIDHYSLYSFFQMLPIQSWILKDESQTSQNVCFSQRCFEIFKNPSLCFNEKLSSIHIPYQYPSHQPFGGEGKLDRYI